MNAFAHRSDGSISVIFCHLEALSHDGRSIVPSHTTNATPRARIESLPAEKRTPKLGEKLAAVWERSVRATHHFLTEDDIAGMRPFVGEAVCGIGRLAIAFGENDQPLGFAGVENGKLEMLFIDSAARGKGVGRGLLAHAVEAFDAHRLDVNEQNPQAVGFYEHEGWRAVYRSSRDDAGRPFPYIRMQRESGIRAEMASGDWYESADPALAADRLRGRRLMRAYDDAYYANEGGADILHSALGAFGFGSDLTAGARVDYGYNVFVGDRCFFNYDCTFLDGAHIVFGDDVMVGPRCSFVTPIHPLHPDDRVMTLDERDQVAHVTERNAAIHVSSRAWLAANVTVTGGVTIGEGAVIGAGSVVTRDIPANTFACGVPCRPVRPITDADRIGLDAR